MTIEAIHVTMTITIIGTATIARTIMAPETTRRARSIDTTRLLRLLKVLRLL